MRQLYDAVESGYITNRRIPAAPCELCFSVAVFSFVVGVSALPTLPAEHVFHCFGYKAFIFFWCLSVRNHLSKKHTYVNCMVMVLVSESILELTANFKVPNIKMDL